VYVNNGKKVIRVGSGEKAESREYRWFDPTYYCPTMIKYEYRFKGSELIYGVVAMYGGARVVAMAYDWIGLATVPDNTFGKALYILCMPSMLLAGGLLGHGIFFRNVSGPEHLPGYDPHTMTVPELEQAGIDTHRLWCDLPTRLWFRKESLVWFFTKRP
jgi:hypothetical protein